MSKMTVRSSKRSVEKKLNDYLHVPQSLKIYKNQTPKINSNKSRRFHTESTSQSTKKFVCSTSFYDNFQFIDRLTNNKLAYKDARKSCGSSLQLKKNTSRIEDRSHLHNLMEIYRKTKLFEMKNLRKRIFKNIDKTNQVSQIKSNNSLEFDEDKKKKSPNLTTIMSQNSSSGEFFKYQSHKKNKLRSFIDRTITEINKAELNRMATDEDFILREEVIAFNEDRTNIKCDLDKDKIDELIYFREKQQFELGQRPSFKQKQEVIVFKELTNQKKSQNSADELQQNKNLMFQSQKKKKKTIEPKFEDQFMDKMIIHTKNQLKREGEYLITPSRENERKCLLLKTGKNKYAFNNIKSNAGKTQNGLNLTGYQFERKDQSHLVKDLKGIVQNNRNFSGNSLLKEESGIFQDQEKNLMYLLKHNYISGFSLELTGSQCGCMARDYKGNNLLHIAVKLNLPEAIEIILKKVSYNICMELLGQKNNAKRTPLQYSLLLVNRETTQVIENYLRENKQKSIIQGWINNSSLQQSSSIKTFDKEQSW